MNLTLQPELLQIHHAAHGVPRNTRIFQSNHFPKEPRIMWRSSCPGPRQADPPNPWTKGIIHQKLLTEAYCCASVVGDASGEYLLWVSLASNRFSRRNS